MNFHNFIKKFNQGKTGNRDRLNAGRGSGFFK
jgi:hypothetical protein